MIDWNAVRTAYITTQQTCAELGRAFGVSASLVSRHARAEHWAEQRREHQEAKLPQDKYARLVTASNLLDERLVTLLKDPESISVKEAAELGRAIKTALEVKAVLQDKVEGPTQITVRFENPAWAE